MKELTELKLVETCGACPEQYDLFADGQQIGYFRLRNGSYSVRSPTSSGALVYQANPRGDGIFESYEREKYLLAGIMCCLVEGEITASAGTILDAVKDHC